MDYAEELKKNYEECATLRVRANCRRAELALYTESVTKEILAIEGEIERLEDVQEQLRINIDLERKEYITDFGGKIATAPKAPKSRMQF